MKGADVVMQTIVQYNDWLEEEVKGHDFVKEIQNFNFEQINLIYIYFFACGLSSVWKYGKRRASYFGGCQENTD